MHGKRGEDEEAKCKRKNRLLGVVRIRKGSIREHNYGSQLVPWNYVISSVNLIAFMLHQTN